METTPLLEHEADDEYDDYDEYDEALYKKNVFWKKFLPSFIPGVLTLCTIIIYSTIQEFPKEVTGDFLLSTCIITAFSLEVLLFIIITKDIDADSGPKSTLVKVLSPISQLIVIIIFGTSYIHIIPKLLERDAERQLSVVIFTIITYCTYAMITAISWWAYRRITKDKSEYYCIEDPIDKKLSKYESICTPN